MKLMLEVEPGETLEDACREAQKIADAIKWPVEFQFNSVDCVAEPGGDPTTLYERQYKASRARPKVTSL